MSNLTFYNVKRQINALNCGNYEVGVRDANSGKMMIKDYSKEHLLQYKTINYLRAMNHKNNDIYIRPGKNEEHGLILLDDLEWMDCEQLFEDGLSPCCCIETSHENYQAWLNFGFSLEPEVRSELARRLAVEYDADVNSADHRHFGRLAGYTNRKLEHLTERGFQYCKCRKSGQYVVEKAEDLINSVRESIATRGEQVRKIKESVNQLKSAGESGNVSELQSKYENMFEELKSAFGTSFDPSRADWMFCERAILQGYSYNEIEEAMSESELTERKGKESEKLKYLERTIKKCFVWVELKKQGYSFDEVAGNLINMVTLERSNKRSSNQEEERDLGGPTPA